MLFVKRTTMSDSPSQMTARRPSPAATLLKNCAMFVIAGALAGVSLIGGATAASAAPSDLTIADVPFGVVHTGTSNEFTFTLENGSATESQDITGLTFESYGEDQTSITDDQCASVDTLAPGATCDIVVDFHPTVILDQFIHGIQGTLDGTYIEGRLRGATIGSMEALDGLTLDFGSVYIGEHSTEELILTNTSGRTITVSETSGSAGGGTNNPFLRISDCDGEVLAPMETCTLEYTFTPLTPGTFTQNILSANFSVLGSSFRPEMTGEGVAVWDVTPDTIDFGQVPVGHTVYRDITVTNVSGLAQEMPPMTSRDFNSFIFTTLDCTTGVVFAMNESCTVTLEFTARHEGFTRNNWDSGLRIGNVDFPIAAEAVGFREPDVAGTWDVDTLAFDFGEVTVGESAVLSGALTFVGEGVGIVFPKFINLGAGFAVDFDCPPYTALATGDSCTFTVTFTPTAEEMYSGSNSLRLYGNEFELTATGTGVIEEEPGDEPVDPTDPVDEPVDPTDPGDEPVDDPVDTTDPADSDVPAALPPVQQPTQQPTQDALPRTGAESSLGMLGSALALMSLGGFLLMRMGRRSSTR